MSNQEAFWKQILNGDIPQQFYIPYQEFLAKVRGDHLIHFIFSCGCWRFIEARAIYQGRDYQRVGSTVLTPSGKYTYQWHYFYPKTQVDCGSRIVDESWLRRRLQIFSMRVGYTHGYADHVFRTNGEQQIAHQLRVTSDIAN